MGKYAVFARVVLTDRVIEDGAVVVDGERIAYVGPAKDAPASEEIMHYEDKYLVPGYIDIHCHASLVDFCHEEPEKVAEYHLSHGTVGMLHTIYRNIPHDEMLKGIGKIKEAMKTHKNILGVHLEGPYLNPMYGTGSGCEGDLPDPEKYRELIATGIIKQWTYAPEVAGSREFCRDIAMAGIAPAIGHTKASPEEVHQAELDGATIVTHLFDATGCAIDPTSVGGTKEVNFDNAVLASDKFFYEVICDKKGIHVRPDNIKLAIKAGGIDRIVGITDSYKGPLDDEDADILFINGELSGSKLTMDIVAKNFRALGLSIPDVYKVTALNPANSIKMGDELGSIAVGKLARMLVVNENLDIQKILI
ncbi:MAG: hypothetical protein E7623_06220 [Ruminococcaceae bacterium]|nr:hypothetical protein [Oscillospiraceae bacterium]